MLSSLTPPRRRRTGPIPLKLDATPRSVHAACMATKTISLDLEAYERLRRARLTPDESFSRVVKRAVWPGQGKTCGGVLEDLAALPAADEGMIGHLEAAQRQDQPPDDPWS